ncbi:MAG: hypothetical protein C4320_01140 [Armatimonadota bacterium]
MTASAWRIALWVGLVLALCGFLYLVRVILFPFILAFALAALLYPLVSRLERARWPRFLAIIAVLGIFFGTLGAVGVWLTPIVSQQVVGFKARADEIAVSFLQPDDDRNFFVQWNPEVAERSARSRDVVDSFLESQHGTLERLGHQEGPL